ncbi:MAG: hypothetical protein ACLUHK_09375 [Eubacteriales bacterium]
MRRIRGEDERALFQNKVPTAKRTDALAEVLRRAARYFAARRRALPSIPNGKSGLYALGAKAPAIDAVRAHEAFSAAAELADTLSVPALMRDFGLLT